MRTVGDKEQFFEPKFETDLLEFLRNPQTFVKDYPSDKRDFQEKGIDFYRNTFLTEVFPGYLALSMGQKIEFVRMLLKGLREIHKLPLENSNEKNTLFHGDIKTQNIVVSTDTQSDAIKLAIIDFGHAGNLDTLETTQHYLSPEYFTKKSQNPSLEEIRAFNRQRGQQRDIWALGLVLANILIDRADHPPHLLSVGIKCINDVVIKENVDFSAIEQKDIDKEIGEIKNNPEKYLRTYQKNGLTKAEESAWNTSWDLVKQMLQLDPDKRIKAEAGREQIRNMEGTFKK